MARFDRGPLQGFVQTPEGLLDDALELLTREGTLLKVPYAETKAVCFIRDFDSGEVWKRDRAFLARPKSPGLWIRFVFRDGDTLEGLLPNDLLTVEAAGFQAIPPDANPQNQRVFVPKAALTSVEVLGVVGSPLKSKSKAAKSARESDRQLSIFD